MTLNRWSERVETITQLISQLTGNNCVNWLLIKVIDQGKMWNFVWVLYTVELFGLKMNQLWLDYQQVFLNKWYKQWKVMLIVCHIEPVLLHRSKLFHSHIWMFSGCVQFQDKLGHVEVNQLHFLILISFTETSARALELFLESLLTKACQVTQSRNAKTMTTSHL